MSLHAPLATLGRGLLKGFRATWNNPAKSAAARRKLELSRKQQVDLLREGVGSSRPGLRSAISLTALPNPVQPGSAATAFKTLQHYLVQNVLRRVTNTQSRFLRKRTVQQLFAGRSAPFLALVGVSLASGNGIITKEDEVECVCSEIRHAAKRIQWKKSPSEAQDHLQTQIAAPKAEDGSEQLSLSNFHFGKLIAKGCNAVVYAGKWITKTAQQVSSGFQVMEGTSESTKLTTNCLEEKAEPVAIKMMFNYEAESNSLAILNAMRKEILPAKHICTPHEIAEWAMTQNQSLPPHPNVVEMHAAFTDYVPDDLSGAMSSFPDALPRRINPEGFGRNMSLFLVMKHYDMNVKEYMAKYSPLNERTTLLLLTQLLEGVTHLTNAEIAHRDLKADNLLLSLAGGAQYPALVITDFGCSLADKSNGLLQRFPSADIDRGGNRSLMAPEVATAKPGTFATINYAKADVWAVGAIAYELFGEYNPFYGCSNSRRLDSRTYTDADLPVLPERTPPIYTALIHGMLKRDPSSRLSAEQAATICQLLLWAPGSWYKSSRYHLFDKISSGPPGRQDVLQWLLTMMTKVLCESSFSNTGRATLEYQVVATFLSRLNLTTVRFALNWIRCHY